MPSGNAGNSSETAVVRREEGGDDVKSSWEKPCGGGLTHKAYSQYPFLIDNDTPKRLVTETVLAAPKAGEVTLNLGDPLLIYSRYDLNRMTLVREDRVVRTAGVSVVPPGAVPSSYVRTG